MNFNVKEVLSKIELLSCVVLGGSLCFTQLTRADLVSVNPDSTSDRLKQLSKTLADGSYTHPDEIIQKNVKNSMPSVIEPKEKVEEENPMVVVLPEDYIRLKINPLYSDSVVLYDKNKDIYYESKNFSNNITMIYNHDENIVAVLDNDDGTPIENSWQVSCSKDHITDVKTCYLKKFELGVLKSSKLGTMLTVSSEVKNLNLREFNYIRIDKNQPHKTKGVFLGQAALNIINQMKNGELAYTRFNEWNGKQYEETISLWGFSVAYDVMGKVYSRLK